MNLCQECRKIPWILIGTSFYKKTQQKQKQLKVHCQLWGNFWQLKALLKYEKCFLFVHAI